MAEWSIELDRNDLSQISRLWRVPGVMVLQDESSIWLRGLDGDPAVRQILNGISSRGRYQVEGNRALIPFGQRVPNGYLPQGDWVPLTKFFSVTLPASGLPAHPKELAQVRLEPTTQFQEPNVLLTSPAEWSDYGLSVPRIRLQHLRFAVSGDGRVLIQGTPLPSLAGIRCVSEAGLAIPCGWTWTPAVSATLLAKAWHIPDGELWLMWPGKPIERILNEHWVAAGHSAIRQSFQRVDSPKN